MATRNKDAIRSTAAERPPEKSSRRPKKGTLLRDSMPSARKVNALRDGRVNLGVALNIALGAALLASVLYLSWNISRPHPPAPLYVQYPEYAGLLVHINTVNKEQLHPPGAAAAASAPVLPESPELDALPTELPVLQWPSSLPIPGEATIAQ